MPHYDTFFQLLHDIVNAPQPWQEKRDDLLRHCQSDADHANLEELATWFQSSDDPLTPFPPEAA